jgi:hypothetical protein
MALFLDSAPGRPEGQRRFGIFKDSDYWEGID